MLYPLKFEPIYKEKIWGGDTLKTHYGRAIQRADIGESWDVACHDNGVSIIANGELAGKTLLDLFDEQREALIGEKYDTYKKFPLLYKFIDANDSLSVQVHPNDAYANEHENGELGKTEMWLIIAAKEGAELVAGVKEGVTKEGFAKAVKEGKIGTTMNMLPVQAGDVVNIPAGLLHAIGEGILLCEVQQNSDTTYRVYDWDRVDDNGIGRELHIEKSIDVINFDQKGPVKKVEGITTHAETADIIRYIANDYFAVDKIVLKGELALNTDNRFHVMNMIVGNCTVTYNDMVVEVAAGESVLLPACLGDYAIEGSGTILKSYVPELRKDIYDDLTNQGIRLEEIISKMAIG